MKKTTNLFLLAASILTMLVFFSGCSFLLSEPDPSFDEPEVGALTFAASKGGSTTVTIKGTTIGATEAMITNYTGELKLFNAYDVQIGETKDIDGDFEVEFPLTFASVGTYAFTAEVSDTYDHVVTKDFTVKFLPSIVSSAVLTDLDDDSAPKRVEIKRTSSADAWYSMKMDGDYADGSECFHWADVNDQSSGDSYTANVSISIYDHKGTLIAGPRDNGWVESSFSTIESENDGIKLLCDSDYVEDETLFVKVSGTTGSFCFYTLTWPY